MAQQTTNRKRPDFFDSLRSSLETYKRQLSDSLSRRFNRLTPGTRRIVLIASGLLIAALCIKLVFAPGEFNVSFGAIHRTITAPSLQDSIMINADSISSSQP